jgi:hypothetical protein
LHDRAQNYGVEGRAGRCRYFDTDQSGPWLSSHFGAVARSTRNAALTDLAINSFCLPQSRRGRACSGRPSAARKFWSLIETLSTPPLERLENVTSSPEMIFDTERVPELIRLRAESAARSQPRSLNGSGLTNGETDRKGSKAPIRSSSAFAPVSQLSGITKMKMTRYNFSI